jgi:hypothetical protein
MESTEEYRIVDTAEETRNAIAFHGPQQEEMLRISGQGFWVRGVKVTQDDQEAKNVYNAFTAWLAWVQLNQQH